MANFFIEIGRTGLKRSAGYVYDEFLSSLRGRTGIKTYREMGDNDAVIGGCLHAIIQILREMRWSVKTPPEGSEADAKFLERCMYSMQHSWIDFISDVYSMLIYGFSLFEQVFRRDDDGRIVWKKLAFRSQLSFERWDFDDYGEVVGFWQRPAPHYREFYIPMSKCIHFRTRSGGRNPEGRSILRNAYRSWFFKKSLEELEAIGIERDLVGMPVLKMPEGVNPEDDDTKTKSVIASAKKLIANLRRDEQEGVLLPYGWELDLLSAPGKKQFDTTSIINRYNKEIAITVLAQFVMLGMERTGSYALAREQTDMFYLCLEGWADAVATTFNRTAVPLLFKMNGITNRPLPYIVHTQVRRQSLRDLADYVSRLTSVGALELDEGVKAYLKRYARLSEYAEVRE
ncbi:MAG: hypothetical protein J7J52_04685 [Deltaproteobacteria bacterium]|nr:hypothetical protein [Deltaproteobacteria bacterium]